MGSSRDWSHRSRLGRDAVPGLLVGTVERGGDPNPDLVPAVKNDTRNWPAGRRDPCAQAPRASRRSISSGWIGTWAQRSTGPFSVTSTSFSSRTARPSSGI